jgi:hypothetical protein
VKVDESGWAWMVCGKLLIIWKICQTVVAKVRSAGAFLSCYVNISSGHMGVAIGETR